MKYITIDCTGMAEPAQLHSTLAQALVFPRWYGKNLDALFDCLSDICEDTTLQLTGWSTLDSWKAGFAATFADAQTENPYFRFTLYNKP